eukprot:3277101-Prymnesium_polylepis.1
MSPRCFETLKRDSCTIETLPAPRGGKESGLQSRKTLGDTHRRGPSTPPDTFLRRQSNHRPLATDRVRQPGGPACIAITHRWGTDPPSRRCSDGDRQPRRASP